jgi:poly(hydroxyalkanoate) depolymerase family esterase
MTRKPLGETLAALRARGPVTTPSTAPTLKSRAPAPGEFLAGSYVGAPGRRDYKLYVPAKPAAPEASRLIVMLHGCTQNPDDFALGTGMNALAEARGWHVLYPAQPMSANVNRCWNWFRPGDQTRERGEPAILAAMTRDVMSERDIRLASVAGLSAGGAMAMILGDAFPELFDAALVHSGLAVGAAQDAPSAFAAMRGGPRGPVKKGFGPRLMIVQGMADATVSPVNADAIEAAATPDEAPEMTRQETPDGAHATERRVWRDAGGRARMIALRVAGLGHAWSGGDPAGSYADPAGPNVSEEFARFLEA